MFIEQLSEDLELTSLDQWHTTGTQQIGPLNTSIVNQFGGLAHALSCVYPNHPWEPERIFAFERISHRLTAKSYLTRLFPGKGTMIDVDRQNKGVA